MRFLKRENIDIEKWDEEVSSSTSENVFSYSWYLDAVSENWGAVVQGDYESFVPITYSQKFGVKQFVQAKFTREFEIFGSGFDWNEVAALISKDFKLIDFRTGTGSLPFTKEERKHQVLDLCSDFEQRYSTNAKRLIKKAGELFTYTEMTDVTELIEIFTETAFDKIDTLNKSDLENLMKLMNYAAERDNGETIGIYQDGLLIGAGFFLKDKKRITYLKGAAHREAKKEGAMFGLMDYAFQKFKPDFYCFDFGGSNLENVATFYKKFGAVDRTYYNYKIDNLPLWLRTLKKIKK